MENAVNWITAHWGLVSAVAAILIWICQVATNHWSGHTGLAKVLLFVVEILSPLTSKDVPGWIKWPLTSKAPDGKTSGGGAASLLILLLPLASCATTPRGYLAKALEFTAAADKLAIPAINEVCKPKVKACGAVKPEACPAYLACEKALRAYQAAADAVGAGLEGANKALIDVGVQ